MKTVKYLSLVFCLTLWGFQGYAQQKDWVGSWQYDAPQADVQYQKGIITFAMEGQELKAFLEIDENKVPAQSLEVSENSATFSIVIQGQPIKITLRKEDEKLTGEATYPGTAIPITAEKSV